MKNKCLIWMTMLLLSVTVSAAAESSLFPEGDEQGALSLKSGELPDTKFFRQNEDNIAVSIVSDAFPDIVLHVSVSDSHGNPISGLTQEDFSLMEQSGDEAAPVTQSLTCFEEGSDSRNISFALVFDVSESMELENRLPDAKTAANNFLRTTKQEDRAALVTFSGCDQGGIIIAASEVGTDSNKNGTPDINEAVSGLTTIERTAVYDGIGKGIDSISAEPFPKGVIVFTDGESNHDCHYSINEVIRKAKDTGIPVYTIGLKSGMNSQLALIAEETGGYYREAPTAADMETIYKSIADSIRGQYTLCYSSHNPSLDGTERNVTVLQGENSGSGSYTVAGSPDSNPPLIQHTPTGEWPEKKELPVRAQVSDPDAEDHITEVILFYRIPGDEADAVYTRMEMTNTDADNYAAEIPAEQLTAAGLEYYIRGCNSNQICSSSGSAQAPHTVAVQQNHPPVIVHAPLTESPENLPIDIPAQVSDPDEGDSISRVLLFFRIPGTATYGQTEMSQTSGNSHTGQIPAAQVTTEGLEYYIHAWDSRGAEAQNGSAASPHRVEISRTDQPPVAHAGSDQAVNEGEQVSLDASASTASAADGISEYVWRQISGTAVTLSDSRIYNPVFTAPATGPDGTVLDFELTVTDSAGLSASDTVRITVNDALAPVADFTWSPASPEAGDMLSFSDHSLSKGGDIVSWEWDFGGEGSDTAANPAFSFMESGSYSVRLTVKDAGGTSGTTVRTLTVSEPPCVGEDCGSGSGGCFIRSLSERNSKPYNLLFRH